MPTDDDDARRAVRGTTERMTGKWPTATPGIPVGKLPSPPRPKQVAPPPASVLLDEHTPPSARFDPSTEEPTRNDLPTGRQRPHQATLPDNPAPPPQAPPARHQPETLDTSRGLGPPPRVPSPSPESTGRVLVANPYDSEATKARSRVVLERHGDELRDAPRSEAAPRVVVDQPWWRTAKGVAVAVPVIVAGLGGLTPAVVLPIIKAIREPYEGAKAADIEKARKAGEQCEAAVPNERKATIAREEAIEKKIADAEKRTDELARRVPAVKADPNRPPKPQ